jgi:hypothetical protein
MINPTIFTPTPISINAPILLIRILASRIIHAVKTDAVKMSPDKADSLENWVDPAVQ